MLLKIKFWFIDRFGRRSTAEEIVDFQKRAKILRDQKPLLKGKEVVVAFEKALDYFERGLPAFKQRRAALEINLLERAVELAK